MKNNCLGLLLSLLLASFVAPAVDAAETTDGQRLWLTSEAIHDDTSHWLMKKAGDANGSGESISAAGYDTTGWMEAVVPGTVLQSLVWNKVYPEPYYGVNNRLGEHRIPDIAEVGRDFYTYWFRTEFALPDNYKGKTVWMQLDGINYRAEVWLNGVHIGTRIAPPYRYDISAAAHEGVNRLVIEVDGSQHYTRQGSAHDDERTAVLQSRGLKVLRFSNAAIDLRFPSVCKIIQEEIQRRINTL